MSHPNAMTPERVEHLFTHHPPTEDQIYLYNELREAAKTFALTILRCTPEGPDQTRAVNSVRDAVMIANAAIACHIPGNIQKGRR